MEFLTTRSTLPPPSAGFERMLGTKIPFSLLSKEQSITVSVPGTRKFSMLNIKNEKKRYIYRKWKYIPPTKSKLFIVKLGYMKVPAKRKFF